MVAKYKSHLPNVLTVSRIAATPLIVAALWCEGSWLTPGLVLFTLASITDFYDGYYARKFGVISKTGSFLDPLADKILVNSLFAVLCCKGLIAWWVFAVIVGRELLVTMLRMAMVHYGFALVTSHSGKLKTVVQIASLYACFFHLIARQLHDPSALCASPLFPEVFVWAALVMTVYSGAEYLYRNRLFLWCGRGKS